MPRCGVRAPPRGVLPRSASVRTFLPGVPAREVLAAGGPRRVVDAEAALFCMPPLATPFRACKGVANESGLAGQMMAWQMIAACK